MAELTDERLQQVANSAEYYGQRSYPINGNGIAELARELLALHAQRAKWREAAKAALNGIPAINACDNYVFELENWAGESVLPLFRELAELAEERTVQP